MFTSRRLQAGGSAVQEFHLTLQAMKDAVEGVAQHSYIAPAAAPGVASALASQLAWLLGTAAGYAQKTLSKADVAAVFLSRKVLLDRVSLQGRPQSTLKQPALETAMELGVGYLEVWPACDSTPGTSPRQ